MRIRIQDLDNRFKELAKENAFLKEENATFRKNIDTDMKSLLAAFSETQAKNAV